MKYKLLLLLLIALTVLCSLLFLYKYKVRGYVSVDITFDTENGIFQALIRQQEDERIVNSWYSPSQKTYYFFMPSFAKGADIHNLCEENAPVDFSDLIFMYSENIPSVFIDTDSLKDDDGIFAAKDYLYLDKKNTLSGKVEVITSNGTRNYYGAIEGINGRGNSTWRDFTKRPFDFFIKEKESILGLRPGKKWTLLALAFEGTHLNTYLSLDIAEAMKMPYTPSGEWVDFYLNGEYQGNYLLIEPISVGDGRVSIDDLEKWNKKFNQDIENAPLFQEEDKKGFLLENGDNTNGGFLIEKEFYSRYENNATGFITGDNEFFYIKSPKHASYEQVEYIKGIFQTISDSIESGNPDYNALDLSTIAAYAVLQEITHNKDAFNASMYFYKSKGIDKVYVGPIWDMDNTFGETNDAHDGRNFVNPRGSLNKDAIWYHSLKCNEEFENREIDYYIKLAPTLEDIFYNRIDEYSNLISASMKMDEMRWELKQKRFPRGGQYYTYESNLRFLKWFYSERINFLYDSYGISHEALNFEGDGTTHIVILKKDDQIYKEYEVMDGELFGELPKLDESIYEGWYMEFNNVSYQSFLPVLEDAIIYAKKFEE